MVHKNRSSFVGILHCVGGLALFSVAITGIAVAQNPVPLISQPLVPGAIAPGRPAFTLTVNGTGFVSGAVLKWNGTQRTTTFVNSSQLKAAILASDVAAPQTASITVVNPAPGGGPSEVVFFPIALPTYTEMSRTDYNVGAHPNSVSTADLRRIGKLDLVLANGNDGTISVLLGNDGTFQSQATYNVGSQPGYVAIADFNGDGKLDLAVTNVGSSTVSILLGNGDGTFGPQVQYPTGTGAWGIATADVNRDGKLDLIVTNSGSTTVSVLLGNGDGTFQPHVDYQAGSTPTSVAIGDFNGDGNLDLAVADFTFDDIVTILLGNGDGTFTTQGTYSVGSLPEFVAVADLNGDGKLDLAVADQASSQVSILLGKGDGTFQPQVLYPVLSVPTSILVADFNGDGKLDIAVPDYGDGGGAAVSILFGNGDGTFQPHIDFTVGDGPNQVEVGDFNQDGRLDFAAADQSSNQVSVLLQDGSVSLAPASLNFGVQVVGTASTKTVTLTNVGTATLTIRGIAIAGTNPGDFIQSNNCGSSLRTRSHCDIQVTFAPSQMGLRNAVLTITDSGPGNSQSVPLTGIGGTSGPNATLSANSLTFGTQTVGTTSPPQAVTLDNYGTQTLSITSISTSGDFEHAHNCGTGLASGASCTINISFTPTMGGERTGTLSIADNAPSSPQTVSLRGTGTVVRLNPSSLSFQCNSERHTCPPPPHSTTLTNTASSSLTINSITITGQYFSETNNCPANVGPHKSCRITVRFNPSCQFRCTSSGAISVNDNGGGSPQQVTLTGSVVKNSVGPAALSALGTTQDAAVPIPTGGSTVGTRLVQMVDSLRHDPFSGNATKRELMVRFWYPASAGENCHPATYTSPEVWSYFSQLTGVPLPEVRTNSCLDAPIAEGSHPVVVFTHGYTGTFTDYTFLFEDLASRGYVVAAVDHTYEATAVEFPDGRLVKSVFGSHLSESTWRRDEQSISGALSVRLKDMAFVVDQLNRLTRDTHGPFAGRFDLDKVAVAGHSLGGLAALLSTKQEARFKVAILLDASLTDVSTSAINMPVLTMTMGRTQWTDEECRLWSDLHGPRLAVNFQGAEHVTPSDAVWLAKGAIKTGTMGPEKMVAAVRDYIAAFLDSNLQGRPAAGLLNGPSSDYPDAVVTTQKQALCGQP